eukprot:m.52370 g.52370  ORF g.52370 m.52370 type:complete len:363 (-) comp13497_c0_seq1:185-1273(-)
MRLNLVFLAVFVGCFRVDGASFTDVELFYSVTLGSTSQAQAFEGTLYKDDGTALTISKPLFLANQYCSEPFQCSSIRPTHFVAASDLSVAHVILSTSCPVTSDSGNCTEHDQLLTYSLQGQPSKTHACTLPDRVALLEYNATTKSMHATISNNDGTHYQTMTVNPQTCTWTTAATWTPTRSPFTYTISLSLGLAIGFEPISSSAVRPTVYQLQGTAFKPASITCNYNWSSMALPVGGSSGTLLASNKANEEGIYAFSEGGPSEPCMLRMLHVTEGCPVYNMSDARSDACHASLLLKPGQSVTDLIQTYITTYGTTPDVSSRRVWDLAQDGRRLASRPLLNLPSSAFGWAGLRAAVISEIDAL